MGAACARPQVIEWETHVGKEQVSSQSFSHDKDMLAWISERYLNKSLRWPKAHKVMRQYQVRV